jgi:hypothetical protein
MIMKTNILRATALSLAMLAAPLSMRADGLEMGEQIGSLNDQITNIENNNKHELLNAVYNFAQGLISSATYSDAWNAVGTAEGLQAKAAALWENKTALAGAAIVATATVATIYACRNKIKAGWNRLFGSSQDDETK